MSDTIEPIMIEDDAFSVGSLSNLSFIAEAIDDFFENKDDSASELVQSPGPIQSPELVSSPPPMSLEIKPAFKPLMNSATSSLQQTPRLVSVESMSQVAASAPAKKFSKPTPLDSLKDLAKRKQQTGNKRSADVSSSLSRMVSSASMTSMKPSASMMNNGVSNGRFASVFSKPSDFLRQSLHSLHNTAPSHVPILKRRKLTPSPVVAPVAVAAPKPPSLSALHEACRRGPNLTVAEINDILAKDSGAALRPVLLSTTKKVYNPVKCCLEDTNVLETYQYPLNLAIAYKASYDVLDRLVSAAPDVINMDDGRSRSLHILLRHKPADTCSIDMIMLKQPDSVEWIDAENSATALHVAVWNRSPLEAVRHLTVMHPDALLHRNKHGQTPWAVAQRYGYVSTGISDYFCEQLQTMF